MFGQKINIIMIGSDIEDKGGMSAVVKEYLKAGLDKDISLFYVASYKFGSLNKRISIFINSFFEVLCLFIKLPKAIVHLHVAERGSFFRKLIIFFLSKLFQHKTIVHIHGAEFEPFMKSNRLVIFLVRLMLNKTDLILVLSKLWKIKLLSFCSNKNIKVLYNPIFVNYKKKNEHNTINVLFLGRLGKRKGVYDLIKCIIQEKKYFASNNVKFTLAGDGEVEIVRDSIKKYNVENLIDASGWINGVKKHEHLLNADAIILPSYDEQMPMSILEGMAFGNPIIATTVAGIPEMVENGRNGFLFPAGDIDQMAKALKIICKDKDIREKMGLRSQEIVREKFNSKKIVKILVGLYENMN